MGDLSFYHALDGLGEGGAPLIAGFKGLTFSPSMPGRGAGCVSRRRAVMYASRDYGPIGEIGRLAASAFGPSHWRVLAAFARAMALES